MPVPSYEELLQPTLSAFHELSDMPTIQAIDQRVTQALSLAPEDVMQPHGDTGQTELEYRLAWARTYLKLFGLIENPQRGVWTLTADGAKVRTVDPKAVVAFVRALDKIGKDIGPVPVDNVDPITDSLAQPIPTVRRYWRITLPDHMVETLPGGVKKTFNLWDLCLEHGLAAIGFDSDADNFQVKKFASIQPGDRIAAFLKHKTIGGIGEVTQGYDESLFERRPAAQDYWEGFYWRRIGVQWQAGEKDVDVLPEAVRNKFIGQTVTELTEAEYNTVAALYDAEAAPDVKPPEPNDRVSFLTRTYLVGEQADDLYDLLLDKKQIILYGPPGTGKTFVAQELGKWITGLATPSASRMEMIQFHPAYSYEDFIEGIRPESKSTGDGHFTVDYPPRAGVFRRFCRLALETPDQPHVFIIDEINRGNIPRIFGELMLLLEYRERDVPLPYSGERFRIPPNVYLIGTMNTADRSIALVDFALRRRFHFFQFGADPDLLERWLTDHPVPIPYLGKLYRRLTQDAIDDPAYAVGVSYFMDPNLTESKLARLWRRSIIPYLEEYYIEQQARVTQWQWQSELMQSIRSEA